MIKKEEQNIDTGRTHRKQGGAFDTLANVFRSVKELVFQNGMVIRNRPGEASANNVESVFEILSNKPASKGKLNYMYIGRRGTADDQGNEKRNINYMELVVDHNTSVPDSSGNGQNTLRMSEDGVVSPFVVMGLAHGSVLSSGSTAIRALLGGEGDGSAEDYGGVQLTHYENGVLKNAIVLDKDGIQMIGLPTSASGLITGAIWNDGGTLKIV